MPFHYSPADTIQFLLQEAIAHHEKGRFDQAEKGYLKVLQIHSKQTQANYNLGVLALQQQNPALAKVRFAAALESEPTLEQFWFAYIEALLQLGEQDSAQQVWLEARNTLGDREGLKALAPRISPKASEQAESFRLRGQQLKKQGFLLEAELSWRQAMLLEPRLAPQWRDLCTSIKQLNSAIALVEAGQLAKAQTQLRETLNNEYSWLGHSALLFCLMHDANVSVENTVNEHRRFGERAQRLWPLGTKIHFNEPNPNRILRIGFVSGDLRQHPVAAFIEPILKHLQGRSFQLYAYNNYPHEDEISTRLRSYLHSWHNIYSLDDDAAERLIQEERIDILIDLSGHTAYNRLLLFARKPAPLQASWIGYPGTTGLHAMDYYLLNSDLLRAGPLQEQFVEKLVSLPPVVPFQPPLDAPPINTLPALKNEHLTFASFNRMGKVNDTTLGLWSRVLSAVPNSTLLLGGIDPTDVEEALARCLKQGIDRNRLILCPRTKLQDYLRLHHQVDLLLDTYPYSGGTTTLYGLWMGVPTLTLAGPTLAARQGVAVLYSVGLEALVATNFDEYVTQAIAWADRLNDLACIRASLRARLMGYLSADNASAILTLALEKAWRAMWQRWCRGEPAEAMTVVPQLNWPT